MDQDLARKLELLASNKQTIDHEYMFEMGLSQAVAALLFAIAHQPADIERMRECRKILSKKVSALSAFRDSTELVVLARMAMAQDPEKYIDDTLEIYKIFSKGAFFSDSYMVLTSMIVCDSNQKDNAAAIKARTDEIMRRMAKEHPLLTSNEDLALAALLAMTGREIDDIINDMEECYSYTKNELRLGVDANSIQTLAQILALTDDNIRFQCDKIADLFRAFKDNKNKFGSYLEFPALATLIDVNRPTEWLVRDIIEGAEMLGKNRGFGGLEMDKQTRLMFSAMVASEVYKTDSTDDDLNKTIINNTVLTMIIAEEIALMIIMMNTTMMN